MKINRLIIIFSLCFLASCNQAESIYLNNKLYSIPNEFLLGENIIPSILRGSFDNTGGIASVVFSAKKDLGLTKTETKYFYVLIYSRDIVHGDLSHYGNVNYLGLSKSSFIFDLGNGFRLFDEHQNREWRVVPRNGTNITESRDNSKSIWVADCLLAGNAISTPNLSRNNIDIKTSCDVSVLHNDYMIKVSASEHDFLENYNKIIEGIKLKINSWKL